MAKKTTPEQATETTQETPVVTTENTADSQAPNTETTQETPVVTTENTADSQAPIVPVLTDNNVDAGLVSANTIENQYGVTTELSDTAVKILASMNTNVKFVK